MNKPTREKKAKSRLSAQHTTAAKNEWTCRDVTMDVVVVDAQHHYRISGTGPDGLRYIIRTGTVREWESLKLLLEQYHVQRCLIERYETRP